MDIATLTEYMDEFVSSKGWYTSGSKRPQTPKNIAVSLSIEAAEVLEHVQWLDHPNDKQEFGQELADVALYLLQLAKITDIDLEAEILKKLSSNKKRVWDQE